MLWIAIAAQVLTCAIALALLSKDWAEFKRKARYLPLVIALSTLLLAGLSIVLVTNADEKEAENQKEKDELRSTLRTGLDQSRLLQQEVADLKEVFQLSRKVGDGNLTVNKPSHVFGQVPETAGERSSRSTSTSIPSAGSSDRHAGEEMASSGIDKFGPLPRYLPRQVKDELVECLRKKPGRFSILSEANDDEAEKYAEDWLSVLESAGWQNEQKETPIRPVSRDQWGGMVIKYNDSPAPNSPVQNALSCFYPPKGAFPGGANIWPEHNFPTDSLRIIVRHSTRK